MHRVRAGLLLVLTMLASGCGSSDDASAEEFPLSVAEQALGDYKALVFENYADALAGAESLKDAIDAFLDGPTASTHQAAKQAWIQARVPYGPSEAFRFYDGPIDDPDYGPEGQINAWPLDESYVDYVRDVPDGGLINDLEGTPEITLEAIVDANEAQGEDTISTGYHAIEFLLWGQDDEEPGNGAGKRPFTDYLKSGGTAANHDRRRQYLSVVTDLLVSDLRRVTAEWDPEDTGNFASSFGAFGIEDAVGNLLRSLGSMANAELSGERMTVAYKNRSQEDEHSCFSDNTAPDLLGNGIGIQNVWLGRYDELDGVGIDAIVSEVDAELSEKITDDIAQAVSKLERLADLQNEGRPIDVLISAEDGSPERKAMLEAIQAIKAVGSDIEDAAKALGLSVQLEEPSEQL